MKNGFIKVAAKTCDIRLADPNHNAKKIIEAIKLAAEKGSKLIVFPELCITGYTCGDLFFQQSLLNGAKNALIDIIHATKNLESVCIVGLPLEHKAKLFNCAAVFCKGKLLGIVPKTYIPNGESRYFSVAPCDNDEIYIDGKRCSFGSKLIFAHSSYNEFKIGVEIGEDLFSQMPPSAFHCMAGATIIANLSASVELADSTKQRHLMVASQSARQLSGYLYTNAGYGESSTDLVFAGHNMIYESGVCLNENKPFENETIYSEIDVLKLEAERKKETTYTVDTESYEYVYFDIEITETFLTRKIEAKPFLFENEDKEKMCETILSIQSTGLKKRIEHSGAKTAVIGVSGGLDSTLALLVVCRALNSLKKPYTDIEAITMPCFGTTKRTCTNAQILCDTLGIKLKTIDITNSVKQHFADISHSEDNYNSVYENAQARERTQILMDIANQSGGMVIGTGDLSELALGWATYNGDHMSMYGVNASVPKTLVRYLVSYCAEKTDNKALHDVLCDILDTPVSPELLPADLKGDIAQKTENIVGPYELHDFYLYNIIRFGFSPSKIYEMCKHAYKGVYDGEQILHWMKIFYRRFFSQQFKRSCMPDGPSISKVSLSPRGAWCMPSDAVAKLWLDEIEQL